MFEKGIPAFRFNEAQIAALRQIAPEAFRDNEIDFSALYYALSDRFDQDLAHDDSDPAHYGLEWPGKRQARRMAALPPAGTLVPVPGEGVDEARTRNEYIEGDNLEVLKVLQKSYAGRVKMIYIDPPYNTGHDFIYKDDFSETQESYAKRTSQVDALGNALTTNPKYGGRFHSNWLSMLYPRLRAARNVLREDGVIFISIDHNEAHNLRHLCDEIFGQENFVAEFVRKSGVSARLDTRFISVEHDSILLYAKNIGALNLNQMQSMNESAYPFRDRHFRRRGKYKLNKLDRGSLQYSASMDFPIAAPDGTKVHPGGVKEQNGWCWRWSRKKVQWGKAHDFIVFKRKRDKWNVYFKQYQFVDNNNIPITRTIPYRNWLSEFFNESAAREIRDLFNGKTFFDHPKPVSLITHFLRIATNTKKDEEPDLILDFFSGSGTTGHAVMQANAEDGGRRRFILVQVPEPCHPKSEAAKAGYGTICDVGKERLRRAGEKIRADFPDARDLDTGFRVFRTGRSMIRKWQNYTGSDIEELEALFEGCADPLVRGWQTGPVLLELLLLEGFPLESSIERQPAFPGNTVWKITSDSCCRTLLVCLDDTIVPATAAALSLGENDVFICRDCALRDQDKITLEDKGRVRTI
ncbi:MAG: site-specific DNA-methyltransferase [Treponema sp.]|jgi:adenine-specific DNA-methyltransferase|nr:site-specific DNA-methyltransferase [Treponema sp.]